MNKTVNNPTTSNKIVKDIPIIVNHIYLINNPGDTANDDSLSANWISTPALKDIYTRDYPRIMGNQWQVLPNGTFPSYTQRLNLLSKYFDFVSLNRSGYGASSDLFLDALQSIGDPNQGLLKVRNDIYAAASSIDRRVYVLPYLNMDDIWDYQTKANADRFGLTLWQNPNGYNIGSFEFGNSGVYNGTGHDLWLRNSKGQIVHYNNNSKRYVIDSTNPVAQNYVVAHMLGILSQGFDGIFSDNWSRTTTLYNGSIPNFNQIKDGWNTIGAKLKQAAPNAILLGNSPADPAFISRDICMLEDRIDNVLGTGDKSVAAYFRYSYLARQENQVCADTYWDENSGPFETFRLPMNLLTDNILGLGAATNKNTQIETFLAPIERLGDLGQPLGDKSIVPGTDTGISDIISGYAVNRAVYVRYYTYGVDYMNDTGSTQTVTLPSGTWLRSDGTAFAGGSTVTLKSLTGWVFKKTDSTPLTETSHINTALASVSYAIPDFVDNLTLTGTANINGTGNDFNNEITSNSGNNILSGGLGDDTYIFLSNFGKDTIMDAGGNDTIKFGSGVSKSSLTFKKSGNDLVINLKKSTNNITVNNWFSGDQYKIEQIKFNDGQYLTNSDINKVIQNIAAFNTGNSHSISSYYENSSPANTPLIPNNH